MPPTLFFPKLAVEITMTDRRLDEIIVDDGVLAAASMNALQNSTEKTLSPAHRFSCCSAVKTTA
jgi:hypothetical protein